MSEDSANWAYLTPEDASEWAELLSAIDLDGGLEETYRTEDLIEELVEPGFDPVTDSFLLRSEGRLVAAGTVHVQESVDGEGLATARLSGGVHPRFHGRGFGRALIQFQEDRAGELLALRHPSTPAAFGATVGEKATAAAELLGHRGYQVVRWFIEMRRPTSVPAPEPAALPVGVRLQRWTEGMEQDVLRAHTAAFADHWGWAPPSSEGWHSDWTSRTSRHELSVAALDQHGQVLAYVGCSEFADRELYIGRVGTLRQARGQGLAQACLSEVLRAAAHSGAYDTVQLHVDAASRTGATRLYERIGFGPTHRSAVYQRTV